MVLGTYADTVQANPTLVGAMVNIQRQASEYAMSHRDEMVAMLQLWSSTGLTIVFVTHSIEEALMLADRAVLMSPGPGRIVGDTVIDLPRPRDVASPAFNPLRRRLTDELTDSGA